MCRPRVLGRVQAIKIPVDGAPRPPPFLFQSIQSTATVRLAFDGSNKIHTVTFEGMGIRDQLATS